MHEQPRNRDWVKNAAIIFLVVLLVLTFFSNTIMNRSLPEVATQEVESGSIVARVRGTGTVQANSNTQVKMDRTRVIRSVLVKVGQKVEAGDVLFTLGEGASEEIDAAEETLRNLQASYNRTAATIPEYNYTTDSRKIGILAEKLAEAEKAWKAASAEAEKAKGEDENLNFIRTELDKAITARKAVEAGDSKIIYPDPGGYTLQQWKERQDSIVPEMTKYGLLDGDLISSSGGYNDRSRIEIQISRVEGMLKEATYTVIFKNDNGTELQTSVCDYYEVPVYYEGTPVSEKDDNGIFTGWKDEDGNSLAPVTKSVTYTAQYEKPEAEGNNISDSNTETGNLSDGGTGIEGATGTEIEDVTGTGTEGATGTGIEGATGTSLDDTLEIDVEGASETEAEDAFETDSFETGDETDLFTDIQSAGLAVSDTKDDILGLSIANSIYGNDVEDFSMDEEYEQKAEEQTSPLTQDSNFKLKDEYQHYSSKGQWYESHTEWNLAPKDWLTCLEFCLEKYDECENAIYILQTSSVETYEDALEAELKWTKLYNEYLESGTPEGAIAKARYEAYRTAKDNYDTAVETYHEKKSNNETTLAGYNADLANLWGQIQRAQKKLDDLLGGEEATITARVAGTIQTLDASPGDTKKKDDVIATIEAPDMGYTMSFSVTNDQANRLRVGDTGTVSNFYWGSEITATLRSIQIDQKNPQTNKLLTFDLSGNVTSGTELTISVGQKSANYDVIIPSSAVRTDANGTYVLKLESKNSPLGNRYLARRVPVEVLAVDDTNSAVSAELGYGDYVITSSSSPLKNGELVRLATSG